MGQGQSRFRTDADIDRTNAPTSMKTFTKWMTRHLKAFQYVNEMFSAIIDQNFVSEFNDADRKEWESLEDERHCIKDMVGVMAARKLAVIRAVRHRVVPNATVASIFAGFDDELNPKDAEDTRAIQDLVQRSRIRHKKFHDEVVEKYKDKKKLAAKIGAAVAMATACITGIVFLALHIIPGVNFFMSAGTFAAVTAGVLSLGAGAAVMLSKDEVQRAIEYLKKIDENLAAMQASLLKLRGTEAVVVGATGQGILQCLDDIEAQCNRLIESSVRLV